MELWIRSQDKYTLIKAKNIKIIETKGLKEKLENSILSCLSDMEQVKSYLKDGYSILAEEINVGVYNTKERALEVLDEIQDKFKVLVTNEAGAEFILAKNLVPIIYEMPKD